MGVYPDYLRVRNLVLPSGRFFDQGDSQAHNKVGVITDKMAVAIYGSPQAAVGKIIKLAGLPFTTIGTFRERVDTFGQSEIVDNTMLIPYSVSRYFTETPNLKMAYFSMQDPSMVGPATVQIRRVLQSRHRAESVYSVQNLTALLDMADRIAIGLTWVLLLISLITLLVSGIGIMNIMLATVSARIREIGIRKAMGATNREIRFQFLSEAVLISLIGGILGVVIGLAIPFSVRYLTEYRIPISGSLRHHRHRRVFAGRHPVRHSSRHPRLATRPRRKPALRIGIRKSGCRLGVPEHPPDYESKSNKWENRLRAQRNKSGGSRVIVPILS